MSTAVPEEYRLSDEEWEELKAELALDDTGLESEFSREAIERDIFVEKLEEALHEDEELQLELYQLILRRRNNES